MTKNNWLFICALLCSIGVLGQAPECLSTTQSPDSTTTPVDVGTIITLTLQSRYAISATINGVQMTPVLGTPGVDDDITWQASHTAVRDTSVTATITNATGSTDSCIWIIDINCIDPSIVSVAPVGSAGIVISGTPDCTYTVRITSHADGSITDYDVTVGPNGTGLLDVVVFPDAWIEVGQQGFPYRTDSYMTVPTLGEWAMGLFIIVLAGAGLLILRKNQSL